MAKVPVGSLSKFIPHFTIVNFDDVQDGAVVDNHYHSSHGVKFASVTDMPARTWNTFARKSSDAQTPSNVVSVNQSGDPAFDANVGGIEATFTAPQRYVCISARPFIDTGPENDVTQLGYPYLESFDHNGNFLDICHYPLALGQPGWGDYRPLSLNSPTAIIAKVRFSCHPSAAKNAPIYGMFDRLLFTSDFVPRLNFPLGTG